VKYIDCEDDVGNIIIAIGSAQYHHENKSPVSPWSKNPFRYDERTSILHRVLDREIRKPFEIVPLPDLHNYEKWFAYVMEELPDFDVLYTLDRAETDFFSSQGYIVRPFPVDSPIHATDIREWMFNGKPYEHALPEGTLEELARIDGVDRIRKLVAKDVAEKLAGGGRCV